VDRCRQGRACGFRFRAWPQRRRRIAGEFSFKLAEKIRQNTAALAELECATPANRLSKPEYDIADVATCVEYYGGLANKVTGHVNPVPRMR